MSVEELSHGFSGRAELLVTETLSKGCGLNEGIVETIRHAKAELLVPGAPVIPAGIEVPADSGVCSSSAFGASNTLWVASSIRAVLLGLCLVGGFG